MQKLLPLLTRLIGQEKAGLLMASPLAQRLIRGTAWSFLGVIASRSATLIGSFIAGNILGREVFGQLGMIQSTVIMFGTLAGFGMGVTATKYVASSREIDKSRAGSAARACLAIAWISGTLMSIALYAAAPWLASNMLAAPPLEGALRASAICLLLGAVAATQNGILTGLEEMREVARATSIANTCSAAALVACAWFFGLRGAVASLIIGSLATYLLQAKILDAAASRHRILIRHTSRFDWSMLWQFSIPAVLAGLLTGPVNWIGNALLVNQPDGYREMGAYNAATQFFMALNFIPIVLCQAVLPMLAERMGADDRAGTMKLMTLSIKINALAVWPVVLIGLPLSPWLMRLYGPEFSEAWQTMAWSLVAAGIMAIIIPVGQVLAASGRMWTGLFMNFGWAGSFIVAAWALRFQGSEGLSIARLIAYVMHALWTFGYAWHLIKSQKAHALGSTPRTASNPLSELNPG